MIAACGRAYRLKHKKELLEQGKKYYAANRLRLLAEAKLYAEEHIEERKARREANKGKIAAYMRNRRRTDPQFRLADNLRRRINKALNGGKKPGSAVRDLGCSIYELKEHLENQFQTGMTWNNHGAWHVDHVRPLASFDLTDREQFLTACHYSNLQPLWAEDNLRKGDR